MPVTITAATIAKAKADARPGAKRYEVVDARARGLVLRVGATGAVWQLRYAVAGRDVRLPLGSVDAWTIAEARDLVGRAQSVLRDRTGIPDQEWLDRQRRAAGKAEPLPLAIAKPRDLFAWTYVQGRTKWLDEIGRTRRAATYADYKSVLSMPDLAGLDKKPLPSISRADLAGIVARVHRSGRESTAEHIVRVLRPFWKWLASDGQAAKSGVLPGAIDGLAAPERTLDESDDAGEYVPPLEEVARIIAICRTGAIDPVVACAVELTAWTAQRRRAVAEATIDQFEDIGGGRGLWHVPPASRKTRAKSGARKRPHVIPLPPAVWACVERAIMAGKRFESDYLFPQIRARRKGGDKTSISSSSITHALGFMPGVSASPHDLRRAFGTHGESRFGLLRSDVQAILDHAAGSGDVTGTHYSLHDGTHRTWPIMTAWCDGLQPYIAAAIAGLEPISEIRAAIAAARYGDEDERQAAE
ncbi:integrase family protein [Devosia sp. MC521]|uniref:tyrosine-type recombinase/integrase n=1 Tax=Devosia sp. MC521 TaxID=2759954 RepID=UPI0015F7C752|nr:integrase family protein [Devosia sp. MC521]MBJ6986093.1 integrase family protein [Devosia sp. MC521]QMW61462.1 integrase family protein [Devosia sp. MC521]